MCKTPPRARKFIPCWLDPMGVWLGGPRDPPRGGVPGGCFHVFGQKIFKKIFWKKWIFFMIQKLIDWKFFSIILKSYSIFFRQQHNFFYVTRNLFKISRKVETLTFREILDSIIFMIWRILRIRNNSKNWFRRNPRFDEILIFMISGITKFKIDLVHISKFYETWNYLIETLFLCFHGITKF